MNNTLKNFRTIALLEGISCLLLFLISMPAKYLLKTDGAANFSYWVGMLHGVLFITYIIVLLYAANKYKWGIKWLVLFGLASVVPFATFWVEKKVKQYELKLSFERLGSNK